MRTFPNEPLVPLQGATLRGRDPIVKRPRCGVMDTDGARVPYGAFSAEGEARASAAFRPRVIGLSWCGLYCGTKETTNPVHSTCMSSLQCGLSTSCVFTAFPCVFHRLSLPLPVFPTVHFDDDHRDGTSFQGLVSPLSRVATLLRQPFQ